MDTAVIPVPNSCFFHPLDLDDVHHKKIQVSLHNLFADHKIWGLEWELGILFK